MLWLNIQNGVNEYGLRLMALSELFFYLGLFIAIVIPILRGRPPGFGMRSLWVFILALFAPIGLLVLVSIVLRAYA